ncbi:DMT family transporter [Dysgonomonas sp. ZJ709]|uniref:DMT family transporter n=1 Tax=Dysgonomonas sp. ZJ709 TaxID=2709797 RepID=UPI0013EA1951|nr:DMT family transporter [Dysgonomonas sp. ZJ709]
MQLSSKQQGHLIMLIVMCVFGLNIPVNKYFYSTGLLSPMAVTALRMSFGSVAFWLTSLFMPKEKVDKKDLLILLLGGLCGMAINQGLFAYGLGRTSPVDASIITTSGPLFAMLIAALVLKEPITPKKVSGVFLGGIGAIFLVYTSHNAGAGQEGDALGNISIASASFFYAFYLVITRPLSGKYSPITMMKWMFLFSAIVLMPFGYKDMLEAPLFHQTDLTPYVLIAFTLFGATFFTYMMIPLAQRRIRATTISMYNNVQPLIASGVAIFMGMDSFTIEKLIASILIFSGVYMVTQSKSKADIETEAAR